METTMKPLKEIVQELEADADHYLLMDPTGEHPVTHLDVDPVTMKRLCAVAKAAIVWKDMAEGNLASDKYYTAATDLLKAVKGQE